MEKILYMIDFLGRMGFAEKLANVMRVMRNVDDAGHCVCRIKATVCV